jgi:undecaprenyl-diphosphatase
MIEYFLFLVKPLGYIGIFLVSLISTSTLFLPVPLYLIIVASSALGMNPILVAFFSGLGMATGELTGYFIGLGGNLLMIKKHKKSIRKFERFFKKFGFVAIFLAAFLPFPFDIVGISAGIGRYEIKKFLLATFLGKFLKALMLAFTGFELRWILNFWF